MDMIQMGRFIRLRREALGLTQKELADRVHVTHSAVSKWERGLSLPDTALLTPLAGTLGVTEGELLQGREKGRPAALLKSLWALSPPRELLLRALPFWLGALLLMEGAELLLARQYLARYGGLFSRLHALNPYSVAALAGYALPSLLVGLWLSRERHRRQPFPVLGKNPVPVWLRHCLPGLAAAFALWFAVFVVLFWNVGFGGSAPLGVKISNLSEALCLWEQTGPHSYRVAQSWRNLPWFVLESFLLGEYCFRALVAGLFYSLGLCRYCAGRRERDGDR